MRLNPKDLERAMKKMGLQQETIDAQEVIIRTADRDLVITNPQVIKIIAMGQDSFQVTGHITEHPKNEFTEDDIKLIQDQTGASDDEIKAALHETHGDLAESILRLKKIKEK